MAKKSNKAIKNNEHVKELLSILEENGIDPSDLLKLINNVSAIETHLNEAVQELQAVRMELAGSREEKGNPVKAALDAAANVVEDSIQSAKNHMEGVKAQFLNGCLAAVTAFKEKGVSALNDLAQFFQLQPALGYMRDKLQKGIEQDKAAIAKIEAVSAEYHAAGRHLKNIGCTIAGKEPIADIKPNGKLAELMEAPFKSEIKQLSSAIKKIDNALDSLKNLEKAAVDEKPSVRENMKELQEKIEQEKKEKTTGEKPREASVSL